jgi:hypothetical protein
VLDIRRVVQEEEELALVSRVDGFKCSKHAMQITMQIKRH